MINRLFSNTYSHGKSELNRIDYLDGWRGIAIAMVLFGHFYRDWEYGFGFGRMGVDVFFVLSGLLMSNILFVKRVSLKTFYKRRFSRILPAFFVFLTVMYLIGYVIDPSLPEYENYFYSLFFLRTYLPADAHMWQTGLPIGHIWSLNVEEHAYVFLSFLTLIAFFRKREYIPLLLLGTGAVFLRAIYIKFPEYASLNYDIKTEINASHILLSAGYFLIKDKFERWVPSWLPLLTLGLAMLCYTPVFHEYSKWALSPFLLAFTVNHLDLTPALFKNLLSLKPLRLLGVFSFSVYLWQQPLFYYTKDIDSVVIGTLLLCVSIIVGMFSFYVIENPVRRYLNNNW